LGPILLAAPLSKVWQVRQTVVLFLPASTLAAAKSDAIGSGAAVAAADWLGWASGAAATS